MAREIRNSATRLQKQNAIFDAVAASAPKKVARVTIAQVQEETAQKFDMVMETMRTMGELLATKLEFATKVAERTAAHQNTVVGQPALERAKEIRAQEVDRDHLALVKQARMPVFSESALPLYEDFEEKNVRGLYIFIPLNEDYKTVTAKGNHTYSSTGEWPIEVSAHALTTLDGLPSCLKASITVYRDTKMTKKESQAGQGDLKRAMALLQAQGYKITE